MAPYRDSMSGGFRQPDPLEVTRTISNNTSMVSSISDSPTNSRLSATAAVSECDYDTNPTVLYQAIEAKQWDYAISLFGLKTHNNNNSHDEDDTENDCPNEEDASSTWVVRKEFNGKLRWRLLPLHAAVIFGAPLKLIELLLADYPLAAQCKDDRGMLPLHLAFRNRANWEIIDELLATYPLAVFVSDRKGRTPLKCGLTRPVLPNNQTATTNSEQKEQSKSSFETIAGILELYSQIAVSGERRKVEHETRTLAQTGLTQLRETHHRQIQALRTEKDASIGRLERENQRLLERVAVLEKNIGEKEASHNSLTKQLQLKTVQLDLAKERADANEVQPTTSSSSINNTSIDKMLRRMAETMVRQQKSYHGRVHELFHSYQELVAERHALRSILVNDSDPPNDTALQLESFRKWFQEESKKLSLQERSLTLAPASSSSPSSSFHVDHHHQQQIAGQKATHGPGVTHDATTNATTTIVTMNPEAEPSDATLSPAPTSTILNNGVDPPLSDNGSDVTKSLGYLN